MRAALRVSLALAIACGASCYRDFALCAVTCGSDADCQQLAQLGAAGACQANRCTIPAQMTCGPGDGGTTVDGGDAGTTTLPDVTAVAAGSGFACAITADTKLYCWGNNIAHVAGEGGAIQPTPQPIGSGGWTKLAAGGQHACALAGSSLQCWGDSTDGECGPNAGQIQVMPAVVPAPGSGTWTDVAVGTTHSCGRTSDGVLACWGDNRADELANAAVSQGSSSPQIIATPTAGQTWLGVWAGPTMTCGLIGAQLYCWGDGTGERLGIGGNTPQVGMPQPVHLALSGSDSIRTVAIGDEAVCAVTTVSQALYCWGVATNGAVGTPPGTAAEVEPQAIEPGLKWATVASGGSVTCATTTDQTLYCWGSSQAGALGLGRWTQSYVPPTEAAQQVTLVAVGQAEPQLSRNTTDAGETEIACAVAAGKLTCWGSNRYGQLGTKIPQRVDAAQKVALHHPPALAIAGGRHHACVIDNSGIAECWGTTEDGEADAQSNTGGSAQPCTPQTACDIDTPTQLKVGPFPSVLAVDGPSIAAGPNFTCALQADGQIACWGANDAQQLGSTEPDPLRGTVAAIANATQVLATTGQACVLAGTQTPICWGAVNLGSAHGLQPEPDYSGFHDLSYNDATGFVAGGSNGVAESIGDNSQHQFGDNSTVRAPTLQVLQGGRLYSAIAINLDNQVVFACGATTSIPGVSCWGNDMEGGFPGALGMTQATPLPIIGGSTCSKVSLGAHHGCALCGAGVLCFGDNGAGALGTGSEGMVGSAVPPMTLADGTGSTWVDVITGVGWTCALDKASNVGCWGDGLHGEIGNGGGGANYPTRRYVQLPAP